jgi:hypothetical protein
VPTVVQALIDYNSTTNDISTRETIKGVEARNNTDDIATREIVEGAKLGS